MVPANGSVVDVVVPPPNGSVVTVGSTVVDGASGSKTVVDGAFGSKTVVVDSSEKTE